MARIITFPANAPAAPDVAVPAEAPPDYQRIATPAAAFGAATAQGMEQLGAGILKASDFYDQASAEQAFTNYQHDVGTLLYGDPNDPSKPGFMGLHGEDAMKMRPVVQQQIEDLLQKYSGALSTGRAQLAFMRDSRRFQSISLEQMGRHYEQQANVWGLSVAAGSMAANERSVASSYNDPDLFSTILEKQRDAATNAATHQGHDPVAARAEADNRLAVATVEGALAQNDYANAQTNFDRYSGMMDPATRMRLGSALRAHTAVSLGHAAAEEAMGVPGAATGVSRGTVMPEGKGADDPRGMIPVIRASAIRHGIDPDVAVKVARSEGLGVFSGDNGTSFGALQLHVGGGLGDEFRRDTGLDPSDPRNEPATIDYAMSRLPETGWTPYHGAARIGIAPREGIGAIGPQAPPTTAPPPSTTPAPSPAPGMTDLANAETELAQWHARSITNLENISGRLDPQAYAHAATEIEQRFRSRQTAITAQRQALTELRNATADGYVQKMMKGPIDPVIVDQIAADPHLDGSTRENLWRIYEAHTKQSVGGDLAKYGPQFYANYQRITAADNDPNKIRDPTQLYALAVPKEDGSQDLTLAGVEKLQALLKERAAPERVGTTKMQEGALAYAKHQLSFERDFGTFKLRDPAGEDVFNVGFLPAFFKYWEGGIAAGKSPEELVNKKSLDDMIAPFKRSAAEVHRDMLNAGAETGAALPNTPAFPGIPPGAIDLLKRRPDLRSAFDEKYGSPGNPNPANTVIGAPVPAVEAPVR